MSRELETHAWEVEGIGAGEKLVLVSLADQANDQGHCFPSIPTIARRCCMSVRTAQSHVKTLESAGLVCRLDRPGRSTVYVVSIEKLAFAYSVAVDKRRAKRAPATPAESAPPQNLHPAESAPSPPQISHHTPAESAPHPRRFRTHNPKGTQKEPKRNPTTTTPARFCEGDGIEKHAIEVGPGEVGYLRADDCEADPIGKLEALAVIEAMSEIDGVVTSAIETGSLGTPCQVNAFWRPSPEAWATVTQDYAIPESFADDYIGEFITYWSGRTDKLWPSYAAACARWVQQCNEAWQHRNRPQGGGNS